MAHKEGEPRSRRGCKIAVIEERLRGMDQALELKAVEYERRLDVLNHAHEEARRILNTYVSRELFDKASDELRTWRNTVDRALASDQGRKGVLGSIMATAIAIISVAVSVATYLAARQ